MFSLDLGVVNEDVDVVTAVGLTTEWSLRN